MRAFIRPISPRHSRGFTLLEILLVVIIIGVMASLALLAIGGNDSRLLQQEASRLQQRLLLAQNEAVFNQCNLGLQFTDSGYTFLHFDETQADWQKLNESGLTPYQFELPIHLRLELEGKVLQLQPQSQGNRSNGSNSERLRPQVLLLADGEISAFTLTMSLKGVQRPDQQRQQLSSDGFSPISRQALP
ncbi:type II secretion system minor pseudopilin GspH [Aestuariicella hydrocarbonica]|uniref:Type II secretion system protein H n=1 Tax=Pseudomaricurvus hydrocarbonicus TaxID=1470433 RepID=A0A9E5JSV7_9GAMM|nr:type II secretion system minor pseudopilin GspH [Aestuariicella hydrocarbonica]NHO63941.1 type II secretion system minor pseudopilin GspH [Aestuariicella hydrocarbonica]